MPPRKRPSRRRMPPAPDPVPVVVEVPDPAPEPLPVRTPALLRAAHAANPATGGFLSRRPGDHWRGRMMAYWQDAGTCPSCRQSRVLLGACAGQAAVCDLLDAVAFLASQGVCTCSYAALEMSDALT